MVPATRLNIGKLFQSPREWTPEHLEVLNVEEHQNVPAAVIVGDANSTRGRQPKYAQFHYPFLISLDSTFLTHQLSICRSCEGLRRTHQR